MYINKKNKIIVIVPGIFQNIHEYDFLATGDFLKYNFYIYNYPKLNNPKLDFDQVVLDFNDKISSIVKKYDSPYLVTYSSGSELFLKSNHLNTFNKIVFLSPSVFIKQNISKTLKQSSYDQGLLQFDENIHISKKLASDLDSFETAVLKQPDKKIWRVLVANDDSNTSLWNNDVLHLNHSHLYTQQEYIESFKKTIDFFGDRGER